MHYDALLAKYEKNCFRSEENVILVTPSFLVRAFAATSYFYLTEDEIRHSVYLGCTEKRPEAMSPASFRSPALFID